ncbi:hypothetical protein B4168_3576 [Anoxybacillus flavithermus]|nr:hypothetical protein B4168_3576 [Anoxybacillus flavithermus]OAO87246.1 hypothetical protein GT23_1429 [Parageobacillus thermoglucosidasius]
MLIVTISFYRSHRSIGNHKGAEERETAVRLAVFSPVLARLVF